jgi:hypothetical protein
MCGRRPGTRWPTPGSGSRPSRSATLCAPWSRACPWTWRSGPRGSWPSTSSLMRSRWHPVRLHLRGRGIWELHGAAVLPRRPREGLRAASPVEFPCPAGAGIPVTCAQAVRGLLADTRRWEVRSAGKGSKGERWYRWAWLSTTSPRHWLLIRRHLMTGELAFHYCHVPGGQPLSMTRLIRAAHVVDFAAVFHLLGRGAPPAPADSARQSPPAASGACGRLAAGPRAAGQVAVPGRAGLPTA